MRSGQYAARLATREGRAKGQAMHSNAVEATAVAVMLLVLWVISHGGLPLPAKFSLRGILIMTALVAAVLGVIAFAGRH
jgi:hypothetical protein